jgi:hypothetical protein
MTTLGDDVEYKSFWPPQSPSLTFLIFPFGKVWRNDATKSIYISNMMVNRISSEINHDPYTYYVFWNTAVVEKAWIK